MAVRLLTAPDAVKIVETGVGMILIRDGKAVAANGAIPAAVPKDLPHIDERLEVLGLTDADPDFFEKQAAREEAAAKDLAQVLVLDRMLRSGRRKAAE